MGMPDMRNWSEEARKSAFDALAERDKLYGWDREDNDIAKIGKNGYDEEDYSRDSQGLL